MARSIDRRRLRYLLRCGLVGSVAASPEPSPAMCAESAPTNLEAMLEPIRTCHNMPALAAALVRRSDLVAQSAVGTRRAGGNAEVELDNRFHLGSCTNALTHTGSNTLGYAVIWLAPQRNAALLAATNCGSDRGFQALDAAVGAMIRRFL